MKKQDFAKMMMAVAMALLFIVPSLSGAGEQGRKKQEPMLETSKTTMGSYSIDEEVVQIIRKGVMARVMMNIVGQPGVYFKVQYSETGAENSYALVPKGAGVISRSGVGTVSFDLRKLGKEEIYLKVTTSDTADFSKPRMMPNPLVLAVDQVKIKDRGWLDKVKHKVEHKFESKHRVSAVCGVRG